MTIGKKIRALRQAQNLKQKDLAEKINVSATALTFIEKGIRQPSKEMALRLSRFFNKSTDYFLVEDAPDTNTAPKTTISAETMVDILDAIDEFLDEKNLAISSEQRKQLLKHFCESGCHTADHIKEMLSMLQAMNSDMFKKGK